ncbi:hypothetical protein IE077_001697 [Cardiosporidium cionae]|uniref:DM2 domain-containing protein n=1 Tax=Cardiosporidium cionae TaxID=476202 RepID=A0ABQ7JCM2_9APIC|nr:hypothetical protein IE077_001697 [Cardiosporidium cionae]|eukprot:KAF8821704.1 hypothetical protein IE077_001697 [Cardiosporidium cionae]
MPSGRSKLPLGSATANRSPARRNIGLASHVTPMTAVDTVGGTNEAFREEEIRKRIKLQQKLENLILPECVGNFAPDLYQEYMQLIDFENTLDASISKHSKLLEEAWRSTASDKIFNQVHRKLRVHIFNTYEDQQHHDFELDSLQPKDLLYAGPPSWTLKIQGNVLESEDEAAVKKFSSFFSRIIVITNVETIVWDKRLEDYNDVDGVEIHRSGNCEHEIIILFFLEYQTPTFSLSKDLSTIVGTTTSSLSGIFNGIWNYCLSQDLISSEDPNLIYCDDMLKKVCGEVETFRLNDIPQLLEDHLFPPKPLCITHNLRLRGDWLQNVNTYDFNVETMSLHPGELENWLPSYTGCREQLTLKQQDTDAVNKNVVEIIDKIRYFTARRNFYKSFANSPIEFIDSLLTSKFPEFEKNLLDEYFMSEYKVSDRMGNYYQQPWITRTVTKYLEEQHTPFDSQICKVLASSTITDPRNSIKEEEETSAIGSKRARSVAELQKNRSAATKPRRRVRKEGSIVESPCMELPLTASHLQKN